MKWWGFAPWVAAVVGATYLTPFVAASYDDPVSALIPIGCALFVWAASASGLVIWVKRLRKREYADAACTVFLSIFFLGGGCLLLIPAMAHFSPATERADCLRNLRDLGIAMRVWNDERGRLPDAVTTADGHPPMSWRVQLLPHLGSPRLRDQYSDEQTWDADANLPVARTTLYEYSCPANRNTYDDSRRAYTAYAAVTGPDTCFPVGESLSLDEIPDGPAHTLLLVEACGQNIVWTEPRDVDVSQVPLGVNLPGTRPHSSAGLLSSAHYERISVNGGANALFANGHGKFISNDVDPDVLRALASAGAGDDVKDF